MNFIDPTLGNFLWWQQICCPLCRRQVYGSSGDRTRDYAARYFQGRRANHYATEPLNCYENQCHFFCIYMQYLFTYFIFGTIQLWLNWIRVSKLCIYLLYPNISRYFFKVLTNMLSPEYTESTVQQKRKSEYFGSSYRWQEKGEKNQFSLVQTKHCGFTL